MMLWELLVFSYFMVGIIITVMASIGHKTRFGYPMHWLHQLVGVFFWPAILLIGGRKR